MHYKKCILQITFLLLAVNISFQTYAQEYKSPKSKKPPKEAGQAIEAAPLNNNQGPQVPTQEQTANDSSETQSDLERTATGLRWFFTTLVYPILVVAILLLLLASIAYIIGKGYGFGRVRRFTGGLLPFLMLTFMLLVTEKGNDPIKGFFLSVHPFLYLFGGVAGGIIVIELGRRFMKTDDDRWGSVFNLFLGFMVVFILYSLMKSFLDTLVYFLFAMIMAGGLDIIFRGPSEREAEFTVENSYPQYTSAKSKYAESVEDISNVQSKEDFNDQ